MIVMNSLQDAGAGFQVDTNKVTIITPDNQESLPLQSKNDIAREIINRFLS
jgi:phosphopantothenoylcysteine decarboxylase/phosphopantothenate--cysteine ligase